MENIPDTGTKVNKTRNKSRAAALPFNLNELNGAAVLVNPRSKAGKDKGWPNSKVSTGDAAEWIKDGGNLGVKNAVIPGLDIDIKDNRLRGLVSLAVDLATKHIGPAPCRGRPDSPSLFLPFQAPEGETLRHREIRFRTDAGLKAAIELRAGSGQTVIHGVHPDGQAYTWDRGFSFRDLPVMTAEKYEGFREAFCELLRRLGHTVINDGSGARATVTEAGQQTKIDDPAQRAPSLDALATALAGFPNNEKNAPQRNDFVRLMAAIKASCSGDEEFYGDVVEPWALAFPGNDPEYVRKVWDSIDHSTVGWPYLADVSGYIRRAEVVDAMFSHALPRGFDEPVPPLPPTDDAPSIAPEVRADAGEREAPKKPARFKLLAGNQIAGLPKAREIVQKTGLRERGVSAVFGKWNAGKTFAMVDLSLHVAAGLPWHGRKVEQGAVVYFSGEGVEGLQKRLEAARGHYGWSEIPPAFMIVPCVPSFREKQNVDAIIETIKAAAELCGMPGSQGFVAPVKLVIFDTLARALGGGNENASEDMGKVIVGADRIKAATGAHVMFIHHSGHTDQSRGRGHSSLPAALDNEFSVIADDDNVVTMKSTKQRDSAKGDAILNYRLKQVVVGTDQWGEPDTSCVVVPVEAQRVAKGPKLSDGARTALSVLNDLADGGAVGVQAWRDAFIARLEQDGVGKNAGTRRATFSRARTALKEAGLIAEKGNTVRVKVEMFDDCDGEGGAE